MHKNEKREERREDYLNGDEDGGQKALRSKEVDEKWLGTGFSLSFIRRKRRKQSKF